MVGGKKASAAKALEAEIKTRPTETRVGIVKQDRSEGLTGTLATADMSSVILQSVMARCLILLAILYIFYTRGYVDLASNFKDV